MSGSIEQLAWRPTVVCCAASAQGAPARLVSTEVSGLEALLSASGYSGCAPSGIALARNDPALFWELSHALASPSR